MSTSEDFLKQEFETFKCSRCRQTYKRMAIDNEVKTCPPCLNGKDKDENSMGHRD